MNKSFDDPRVLRGMEEQRQLREERINAGENLIGWKVGFGAPAARERLQIDAPLIGFLTDKTILASGTTASLSGWTKPAVEPEIAVYLGQDLVGKVDRNQAQAAIASIGPAIELADVNVPAEDVASILAGNIYNRHIVLGRADPSRAGSQLDGVEARIYRDRQEIARTTDLQALTGDILDITCHIANLFSMLGEQLHAGEFIIMGSIIPPIWIESNAEIQYDLHPIDSLSINLEI